LRKFSNVFLIFILSLLLGAGPPLSYKGDVWLWQWASRGSKYHLKQHVDGADKACVLPLNVGISHCVLSQQTVIVCHLCFISLSFLQGKIWWGFQKCCYFNFFYYL